MHHTLGPSNVLVKYDATEPFRRAGRNRTTIPEPIPGVIESGHAVVGLVGPGRISHESTRRMRFGLWSPTARLFIDLPCKRSAKKPERTDGLGLTVAGISGWGWCPVFRRGMSGAVMRRHRRYERTTPGETGRRIRSRFRPETTIGPKTGIARGDERVWPR